MEILDRETVPVPLCPHEIPGFRPRPLSAEAAV
jgi:hypothetical protein